VQSSTVTVVLGADDAVDDGHADAGQELDAVQFLPGECRAMSIMTKSAERPTSIPQSSSRR
jgi:hypothetical protein